MQKKFTYLALGDSYTIGESVPAEKNFPNQTVHLLRQKNIHITPPEIIARTGWTTDELSDEIPKYKLSKQYDLVTLLVGVNNQYRGRSAEEYKQHFEELLKKAIHFAGNRPHHVIVLSIPDYSVTPAGQSLNPQKIAKEIDAFNKVNMSVAEKYKVHYIDITPESREALNDASLIAKDQLHPSENEYLKWSKKVAAIAEIILK
ncbi:MAG: SGNH/GDSL hydrolase family protein [Chitinophagaceae bacterium]|nr:SGNH/GDSL hydrolase family protein [Chitinophagaceae bacterium]